MKFLRFWFPVIFYSGIIFYASSIPDVKTPMPDIHLDKIIHILVYALFGFLMARGIVSTKPSIPGKLLVLYVFLSALLYGASDEYHQSFVVGRSAELGDFLVDSIGGTIGGYIYLIFINKCDRPS